MSSKWFRVLSVIIMVSMLLTACAQPTPPPAAPAATEEAPAPAAPAATEEAPAPAATEAPAPAATEAPAPAEPAGEVKIGFISAFTGVFSSFGSMQKEGAELALEE